jgi:hypothetical protein
VSPRRSAPTVAALLAALALGGGAVDPPAAEAQSVRGTARTSARYLEMRTLVRDTVPRDAVVERPGGVLEFDGRPVFCTDGICILFRPGPVEPALALAQEVGFTSWGFGVQGLSATVLVRGRGQLGGAFSLPRTGDPFDAVIAYAELDRPAFRARFGRQQSASQLGAPGFDGASVRVWPAGWLQAEAFGGRSLGRALHEPRSAALRGLDDAVFLIHPHTFIGGVELGMEPAAGTDVLVRYYREIFGDRSALLAERGAVVLRSGALQPLTVRGQAEYDFAFGTVGKAHLSVDGPVGPRMRVEATARRYMPLFELWTIWGFFSPVAYHEAELRGSWQAGDRLSAWASGGWRRYDEANATVILRPLERDGIRVGTGARWQTTNTIATTASYRTERGFGAFLSSGDASIDWRPADRLSLSLDASAFQQIEQFRVGEGIVLGGGASADYEMRPALVVSGGAMMYRQTFENRPGIADWNQIRAFAAVRAGFGRDPGIRARGTGGQ